MWRCGTELKSRLYYLGPESPRLISPRRYRCARYRCIRTSIRVQCSATEVILDPADLLLDLIASQNGPLQPNVVVDDTASTAGRCLRATREQKPDEVLMSVPLSAVFADLQVCCEPLTNCSTKLFRVRLHSAYQFSVIKLKGDEDTYLPWSARMALRLLQQQASCGKLHHDDDALMCPWIDALPRQVLSVLSLSTLSFHINTQS